MSSFFSLQASLTGGKKLWGKHGAVRSEEKERGQGGEEAVTVAVAVAAGFPSGFLGCEGLTDCRGVLLYTVCMLPQSLLFQGC